MTQPTIDPVLHRHLDTGRLVAGKRVVLVFITRDDAAALIPRDHLPHLPLVEVHGAELTPGTFVFLVASPCSHLYAQKRFARHQPIS